MSTSADGEKSRWAHVMDNFDLHFTRMNDIGVIQQELKQHMTNNTLKVDQCTTDQQFTAQQIKANGQAVAQLTMRQSEHEASSISEGFVIADEDIMFENVFANCKHKTKPEPSHQYRTTKPPPKKESLPHHTLPKMHFPASDGTQPKIWLDKCNNYLSIYSIPDSLWVEAATMQLEGNATKQW